MIDIRHHHRSLAAFAGTGPGSLLEALRWAFPVELKGLQLYVHDVVVDDHGWWDPAEVRPTWARGVSIWVSDRPDPADPDATAGAANLVVPWLCDDDTVTVSADLPGARLGGHTGLFVGRPLLPLAQQVVRPGVRVAAAGTGPELVLTPDAGAPLRFVARQGGVGVAFGSKTARSLPLTHEGRIDHDRCTDNRQRRLAGRVDQHLAGRPVPTAVFSPGTRAHVNESLGLPTDTPPADWFPALAARVDHMDQPDLTDQVSPEVFGIRLYGDVLRRLLVDALVEAVRDVAHGTSPSRRRRPRASVTPDATDEPAGADRTAATMSTMLTLFEHQAQKTVDNLVKGRLGTAAVVVPDDDRNTLARVEARRTVTRFGPGGFPSLRAGKIWLRGLHPSQRGALCPLVTPENENIGLIRSLALGARADGSDIAIDTAMSSFDLSSAAALVPFLNHNDPTRTSLGAKNLKQTVPIVGLGAPRVRSGIEPTIAEEHGVCRAPAAGWVERVEEGAIELRTADGTRRIGFGPSRPSVTTVDADWRVLVEPGTRVHRRDVLAHAPDVVLEDGAPVLALGRDCLVALAPWHGRNFEDAIVVSDAIVDAFTSRHVVRWREPLDLAAGEWVARMVADGEPVIAGEPLVAVKDLSGVARRWVAAPESGLLHDVQFDDGELEFGLWVSRPLAVGDKLTNRHGGKGVVGLVVPAADLPRLPDGRAVEVLLNPLGVLRRVSIGQLLELHVSLLDDLRGDGPRVVGRRLDDLDGLRGQLDAVGAPHGRIPLVDAEGRPWGDPRGVVVGWQHLVKLDHLAAAKVRARYAGARSSHDQQPAKGTVWVAGTRVGGAQRLGEMELWAFHATSMDALVDDAIARSDGHSATLEAVLTHLRAAGIERRLDDEGMVHYRVVPDDDQLIPLPERLVHSIVDRKTYRRDRPLTDDDDVDPLYAPEHGPFATEYACACGEVDKRGNVCPWCGTRVRRRPAAERKVLRFKIPLVHPVPHPWFRGGDDDDDTPRPELLAVPVLPPAYRRYGRDPLDRRYATLVSLNELIASGGFLGSPTQARRALERAVHDVLGGPKDPPSKETISARLGGKTGLLRRALRGRNTDLAARVVMVPDPTLHPETIGLPSPVFRRLGLGHRATSPDHDVVVINRQPTLHPYNLVALRAVEVDTAACSLHPLLCKAIAGDFDGDEITVHRPASPTARSAAWRVLRPAANLRSGAQGELLAKLDLDVALGLWLLGTDPDGREALTVALGGDDRLTGVLGSSGPLEPATQRAVATWCVDTAASTDEALARLATLFRAGVERSTGWSLSALDLDPGPVPPPPHPLGQAVAAGVAGKREAIAQLIEARGEPDGFDGKKTPFVASCFLTGLTDGELFATAPGALRALSDKKLVTPLAGGLTKALVELAYDLVITDADCGLADVERSTLTCRSSGLCQRCYGIDPATGQPPPLGARVGLLAALLVGERCTQKAMKTHGGGGTNVAVGGNVRRLNALFGAGQLAPGATLEGWFAGARAEGWSAAETIDPLEAMALDALDGEVAPVHLHVLWRRLWQASSQPTPQEGGTLLQRAQLLGEPLVDATARGRLDRVIEAARHEIVVDARTVSALRRHVMGDDLLAPSAAGAPR